MEELIAEIKKTLFFTAAWGILLAAGAFLRGGASVACGLIFGALGSMLYVLLTGWRVKRSAGLPLKEAIAYMRIGWLIRLSFILFWLLIALRLPFLHFWAVVIGLLSHHVITILNSVMFVIKAMLAKKG